VNIKRRKMLKNECIFYRVQRGTYQRSVNMEVMWYERHCMNQWIHVAAVPWARAFDHVRRRAGKGLPGPAWEEVGLRCLEMLERKEKIQAVKIKPSFGQAVHFAPLDNPLESIDNK
jgi:hypothetical protein